MSKIIPYDASLQSLAFSFDCGNFYLNHFLQSSDSLDGSIARTYVYLTEDKSVIIGYYSITTGCIESIDGDLRIKIGGSVHISYLAVDIKYHKWHSQDEVDISFSDILLTDCIERIRNIQDSLGFAFITLNSTKMGYSLYKRNGFEEIEDDMVIPSEKEDVECIPMYLALVALDY